MKKRLLKLFFILSFAIILVGCAKEEDSDNTRIVEVIVYNKDKKAIYDGKKETDRRYLFDVLDFFNIKIKESNGEISSINDIKSDDEYGWNCYINNELATSEVSEYKIKNDDIITFRIEKYE